MTTAELESKCWTDDDDVYTAIGDEFDSCLTVLQYVEEDKLLFRINDKEGKSLFIDLDVNQVQAFIDFLTKWVEI